MSFLDHIHACNRKDLSLFKPLMINEQRVGWVRSTFEPELARFPQVVRLDHNAVSLSPALSSPDLRSAAIAEVFATLASEGRCPQPRGELYACKTSWSAPELFRIDRAQVSYLGIRAYGVHMNGWVQTADGPALWIGRRALDKKVAPGKLDNMVAGGQPAGLSLVENLAKEAAEEADVPAALVAQARAVGAVTYCMEGSGGLKPDTMFCYDLELPADFTPRNTDGEMVGFELWPVRKALEVIAAGDDFKFNVNLVIVDFALRHGILTPDDEPHYEALLTGLRQPLP
ncbi:DUF4743 domain-containing protein [Insolitispirillum peregrinum]|uniref:Nudix hydrolase domain-containing protein n=1 Tax=Insolitispirillum peregrinum TaxID=80876 RepID=A0A1N7MK22_9PROT|nr:DUF4743 domain-containing protein [Insolitispirillum peregrinum]SIS86514.1 protein of unknown function [Insolitispirillum peregrinum]